jgi:hypothetical protein
VSKRINVDLPLPFGPSKPSRVPGPRTETDVVDDTPLAEALGHVLGDDQPLGAALGGDEVDRRRSAVLAALHRGQLVDQPPRLLDARLRLGRARLGSMAQPVELAPHAVTERLLPLRLLVQGGVFAFEEFAVTAARLEEPARVNRIEVEHAFRDVLEEPAIVADDEKRSRLRS